MCTDSSNLRVLVEPICGLEMTFHVDAHQKCTDSHVGCTRAKILDLAEFHSFWRIHKKPSLTMNNLSISGRSLGIQFMADNPSPFITIPTQAVAGYFGSNFVC
jgi:hypothetical protein